MKQVITMVGLLHRYGITMSKNKSERPKRKLNLSRETILVSHHPHHPHTHTLIINNTNGPGSSCGCTPHGGNG